MQARKPGTWGPWWAWEGRATGCPSHRRAPTACCGGLGPWEDPLFQAQQMMRETLCHDSISQNATAIFIKYTSRLCHMFDVLPPTEAVK